MNRGDRKTPSDDNAANNPTPRRKEPIPYKDLQKRLTTVQIQRNEAQTERDEANKIVEEKTKQAEEMRRNYLEEQKRTYLISSELQEAKTQAQSYRTMYDSEKVKRDELTVQLNTVKTQYKSVLTLYAEEQRRARKGESAIEELEAAKTQAQSYFRLNQDSQTQAQSYLTMYDSEKIRGDELVIQLNEVQGHRDRYLTLYNESQSELKTERKSKAGVKGWETRRKKENEKLKQEISEMAMVLRDSMERKDEAINSLYSVAERMDRIQRMVDSVDDDTATNPIGMVQKLQRMWQAVKEILAE